MRFISIVVLVIFFSCNPKRIDTKRYAQEMKQRIPKKVSEGQILEEALLKGKLSTSIINKELIANVSTKENAYKWCNIKALFTKDSLTAVYNFEINRFQLADTLQLKGKERDILLAYDYSVANKIAHEENLQRLDNETILYNQAILLENNECIKCHTKPIDQIVPKDESSKMNPQLFNRKKGDLLGMWSIKFPQSQLIVKMKF